MCHKGENVKLLIFERYQFKSGEMVKARNKIKLIIVTENSEPIRKQKLDEKRYFHLLGAGQLNYLQETEKIGRHDAKLTHLTTPK